MVQLTRPYPSECHLDELNTARFDLNFFLPLQGENVALARPLELLGKPWRVEEGAEIVLQFKTAETRKPLADREKQASGFGSEKLIGVIAGHRGFAFLNRPFEL